MASPTVESFCCLTTNNNFSNEFLVDFQAVSYNVVSCLAATLGIIGSIYQIVLKEEDDGNLHRGNALIRTRGRQIIRCLATADLMASIGVLFRSLILLFDVSVVAPNGGDVAGQIFCVSTTGWGHYFYTATYFWTFIYAYDVKSLLGNKKVNMCYYHLFGWLTPAVLCLSGLLLLYLPNFQCHSQANPYLRFLPNYLSTFLPILFVMVLNPFLYVVAFSSVEERIASASGRFAQYERQVVSRLKCKFFLINLVFYICWLPNILNGIILWSSWKHIPKLTIVTIWFLMAILNPMQAVFNCLVYRNWDASVRRPTFLNFPFLKTEILSSWSSYASSDERLPLLYNNSPVSSSVDPHEDWVNSLPRSK